MSRSLIIGAGEIGKSLHEVLKEKHESHIRDKEDLQLNEVDVLNICYPYSDKFIKITKGYIKQYKPKLTIIHSTVRVGTTRKIGKNVIHSPVNGKHPNLSDEIKSIYPKFIGAQTASDGYLAEVFFREAGMTTRMVASPEVSEMSKILCTSYYGWNLVFMKEVEKLCEKYGLPFHEVYYNWNLHINSGFLKLGKATLTRPIYTPLSGGIGGHCVVQNCDLLDSFITNTIKKKNEEYK